MVSHWDLSNSKSHQVSRTLLSILADLNNDIVWMVPTRFLISKSSSFCTNPLVTVLRTPIIIGITVSFIFHIFSSSLARSTYLFFPSFFQFYSTAKSLGSLCFWLAITKFCRLAEVWWSVCISKSQTVFVRFILQDRLLLLSSSSSSLLLLLLLLLNMAVFFWFLLIFYLYLKTKDQNSTKKAVL